MYSKLSAISQRVTADKIPDDLRAKFFKDLAKHSSFFAKWKNNGYGLALKWNADKLSTPELHTAASKSLYKLGWYPDRKGRPQDKKSPIHSIESGATYFVRKDGAFLLRLHIDRDFRLSSAQAYLSLLTT